MSRLIVFEGPDGVGKSTQVKKLYDKFKADGLKVALISQPSSDNELGFLRQEIKTNRDYSAFERQLLATCSHIIDSFHLAWNGADVVIMDRCYLSGVVYGRRTGCNEQQIALLMKVLTTVYHIAARRTLEPFDHIDVIFIDANNRLDRPDGDVFESGITWQELRNEYRTLYKNVDAQEPFAFRKDERVHQINVNDTNGPDGMHVLIKVGLGV